MASISGRSLEPIERVVQAYMEAFGLLDERVAPFLGKATTSVLVQGAAKKLQARYPFLSFLIAMPYTNVVPSIIKEQLSGITGKQMAAGLDALLQECFAGLEELTGDLIAPPIHDEVTHQLNQLQ